MRKQSLIADAKTLGIVEGLAKIQCSQKEAAAVLGTCRRTFLNFLSRHPEARDRWEFGQEGGKASLRRNQFKLSETNAAMAIWLGKQYLGQREPRFEGEGLATPLGKKEQAQVAAETGLEGTTWAKLLN